jgi:hypothetical protein
VRWNIRSWQGNVGTADGGMVRTDGMAALQGGRRCEGAMAERTAEEIDELIHDWQQSFSRVFKANGEDQVPQLM